MKQCIFHRVHRLRRFHTVASSSQITLEATSPVRAPHIKTGHDGRGGKQSQACPFPIFLLLRWSQSCFMDGVLASEYRKRGPSLRGAAFMTVLAFDGCGSSPCPPLACPTNTGPRDNRDSFDGLALKVLGRSFSRLMSPAKRGTLCSVKETVPTAVRVA